MQKLSGAKLPFWPNLPDNAKAIRTIVFFSTLASALQPRITSRYWADRLATHCASDSISKFNPAVDIPIPYWMATADDLRQLAKAQPSQAIGLHDLSTNLSHQPFFCVTRPNMFLLGLHCTILWSGRTKITLMAKICTQMSGPIEMAVAIQTGQMATAKYLRYLVVAIPPTSNYLGYLAVAILAIVRPAKYLGCLAVAISDHFSQISKYKSQPSAPYLCDPMLCNFTWRIVEQIKRVADSQS